MVHENTQKKIRILNRSGTLKGMNFLLSSHLCLNMIIILECLGLQEHIHISQIPAYYGGDLIFDGNNIWWRHCLLISMYCICYIDHDSSSTVDDGAPPAKSRYISKYGFNDSCRYLSPEVIGINEYVMKLNTKEVLQAINAYIYILLYSWLDLLSLI